MSRSSQQWLKLARIFPTTIMLTSTFTTSQQIFDDELKNILRRPGNLHATKARFLISVTIEH